MSRSGSSSFEVIVGLESRDSNEIQCAVRKFSVGFRNRQQSRGTMPMVEEGEEGEEEEEEDKDPKVLY